MNEIQIYKSNSKTITCTVSGLASLAGYTPVMTVKETLADDLAVFTVTGSTNDLTITFEVQPTHTNITPKIYNYDVVVSNGTQIYTVVQSMLKIIDSVKY